jgi:hypothetical protein
MTLVSMSGVLNGGWSCAGASCTRSDVLASGGNWATITVVVNVAANAPSQLTNQVTVSGGGSATGNASDPTTIGLLQTIKFSPLNEVTFGTAPFTVSATTTAGLPVTFSSATTPVCTIAGTTVSVVAGGVCTIAANQSGNGTYGAAVAVSRSFLVDPANQIIHFPQLPDIPYQSKSSIVPQASASAGPVSLSVKPGSPCFTDGTTIYLSAPGVCTVSATASGSLNYEAVTAAQNFAITNQTITFNPLADVAVGTAPILLSAKASSGLAVSYASTTPAVCTVSGSTVMIVTGGGCSITASQAGNSIYSPATPVKQSFTVLFGDIAPADHYFAAINAMALHGITSGCGSNDYCPGTNVTRDQMAIFIVRAIMGNDNFTYTAAPYFTDVQPATFGFKWIQKLKDLGITSGCTATTYCPGNTVTRDQMAIFIIRARLGLALAGGPSPVFTYPATPSFTDVPANGFGFAWIQRMKLDAITSGCTATTYCASDPVIRGDMAIFIMRGLFNQFLPAATPVLTQISPSTLAAGTSGTYTITGANTNFVQGTTQLSSIPGVTIGTITVTSPSTLTMQLTAAATAVTQPYSILAITGSEQDVLPNGLEHIHI